MAKQGAMFRLTIILIIIITIILYTIFNSRLLIKGPSIEIFNLIDGQVISSENNPLEITGISKNISFISLNGRQIYIDENREFREKVLLTNKVNPIELFAKDKFGKTITKKITLLYLEGPEVSIPTTIVIEEETELQNDDGAESVGEAVDEVEPADVEVVE